MTDHILNRPAPPVTPKAEVQKPTPEDAKVIRQTQRTKATEAVWRAISGRPR
ncbi:hypothetical protein [Inquilinus sp. CA228]|uniref:hypothetical protein n=1 Tax=Inquilinus sp. CA228 TaxID=3455609 RepID=UPI003F8D349A